jgi:hypothetical protein
MIEMTKILLIVTVIMMGACAIEPETSAVEQHTGTCTSEPFAPGPDGDVVPPCQLAIDTTYQEVWAAAQVGYTIYPDWVHVSCGGTACTTQYHFGDSMYVTSSCGSGGCGSSICILDEDTSFYHCTHIF